MVLRRRRLWRGTSGRCRGHQRRWRDSSSNRGRQIAEFLDQREKQLVTLRYRLNGAGDETVTVEFLADPGIIKDFLEPRRKSCGPKTQLRRHVFIDDGTEQT